LNVLSTFLNNEINNEYAGFFNEKKYKEIWQLVKEEENMQLDIFTTHTNLIENTLDQFEDLSTQRTNLINNTMDLSKEEHKADVYDSVFVTM
jgi:hypothetical protein